VSVERIAAGDDAFASGRNGFGPLVCGDGERTHLWPGAHRGREADGGRIGGDLVHQLGGLRHADDTRTKRPARHHRLLQLERERGARLHAVRVDATVAPLV